MSVYTGTKVQIGIGKESTAGTKVSPTYYIPTTAKPTIMPLTEYVEDESNFGRMEAPVGENLVADDTSINFPAIIRTDWFGLIMAQLMGSPTTATASGETAVYEHTYEFQNDSSHPTLTVVKKDPDNTKGAAYGVVSSLEISATAKDYVRCNVEMIAQQLTSDTETVTYATDHKFTGNHVEIKFASNVAGLSGASAVPFTEFSLNLNANPLNHHVFNSVTAHEILNQELRAELSFKKRKNDDTFQDYTQNGTTQACQITIKDTSKTIGTAENPEITFILPELQFVEHGEDGGNRDIVMENLQCRAHYSTTEATNRLINCVITNEEDGTKY